MNGDPFFGDRIVDNRRVLEFEPLTAMLLDGLEGNTPAALTPPCFGRR